MFTKMACGDSVKIPLKFNDIDIQQQFGKELEVKGNSIQADHRAEINEH